MTSGLHGRGPTEGLRGRERASGGESERALAWRAAVAGGRTVLVLEAARMPVGRCLGTICTHRDGGQRVSVSRRHGVLAARQAQGHVQALIRRARTCLALLTV